MYNSIMDKSECFVDQIVHFTSNGRGRGGHYTVRAQVTKVNSKNALLTEIEGSYWPGSKWNWPIADLRTHKQDEAYSINLVEIVRAIHPGLIEGIQKCQH